MPKSNPKHKQRVIVDQRRAKLKAGFSRKLIAVIILSVIGIGSVAGMIIYFNNNPIDPSGDALVVEWGDTVTLYYELWADLDHDGNIDDLSGDPYNEGSIDDMLVELGAGYMDAFVEGLIGMKEGGTDGFIIPSGEGYTASNPPPGSSELIDAKLYFQVTINTVEKGE